MRIPSIVLALIALPAFPAIARGDDPPPPEPDPDPAPRSFADALAQAPATDDPYGVSFEGTTSCDCNYIVDEVAKPPVWDTTGVLGFVFEERDIGGIKTRHLGLLLGAGLTRGNYELGAELHLGFDRTSDEPVTSGFAGQASVHLRRDLIHFAGSEDDLGGAFAAWLDLGGGAELMWFGGDRVIRPTASLGVGFGGRLYKTARPGRWGGASLEVRVVATPGIEWSDLAERASSGSDMRLTRPDFSGLLVIGVPFSL